ncbi:MAG: lytic transglycosylase domain-containing protein [Spirochaetales bacterium]|nr:lytic transglycosylase domain-containing protein [Spirochaetales bacterium]
MKKYKTMKNFFLYCVLLIGAISSCGQKDFFNLPIDQIKSNLEKGDYNFIKSVNFDQKRLELLPQFSPGASYYFALIFQKEGYKELYQQALEIAFAKEKPPWQEQAGNLLIESYLQDYDYDKARVTAEKFLESFFSSNIATQVKFNLIKSLYWLKKDTEVLSAINTFFPDNNKGNKLYDELMLFKAVAACRLKQENWKSHFMQLFFQFPVSDIQQRAFDFISLEQDRLSQFTEQELSLLWAISLLASKDEKLAIPLIKENTLTIAPLLPENSPLIREIGLAFININQALEGGYFLLQLAGQLNKENKLNANEYAGRCFYKARNLKLAAKPLQWVTAETTDNDQRDRVMWFYLDLIYDYERSRFTEELETIKTRWKDDWYFDDVIDNYIIYLLNSKKWAAIIDLYTQIQEYCALESKLKLAYLSFRLQQLKYVEKQKISNSDLLNFLGTRPERYYYSFLAKAFQNQDPLIIQNMSSEKIIPKASSKYSSREQYISGFFDFGLFEKGYALVDKEIDTLDPEFIYSLLPFMEKHKQYKEIIRIMNEVLKKKNYQLSKEELVFSYPQYYLEEITKYSQKYQVDSMFFLSLVREESAFDKDIVSAAGAIGLSQLMEATAADTARRMKIKEYDLYNADTNLHIGIYHMNQLYSRLNDFSKSLAAYNAGLSRVRDWEKQFSSYPIDLFVELIPYDETRNYIKKITVTMAMYNAIYGGIKVPVTMRRAFQGIFD